MKTINSLLISIILIIICSCNAKEPEGVSVIFPRVSSAIQITNNNKEHLFASYSGINSFDRSQRYVTVLETDLMFKLPDENEPATLGLVDLKTKDFIPLTRTRAWNFQQGCMAHWLETSPDSLIIFNDYRGGKFVSVIMNVHTKVEVKTILYPISAVSPDGKEALSINFARLRITRPVCGYGGDGQNSRKNIPLPKDDGLFLINIETGDAKLIVSYDQIKDLVPPLEEGRIVWFNHTLFSRKGSKILWFSRQTEKGKNYLITTCFTVNRDGTNLQRCFPDNWAGSHFDWLNDDELMITANYEGKQYAHILFTVGEQNYKRMGNGLLDYDGHCVFSPDQKWLVTDTYPSGGLREQKIYLMNMKTEVVLSLGRFVEPQDFIGDWRCDIHCRWSPKSDMIGFNSTHTGSRQVYIFRLTY